MRRAVVGPLTVAPAPLHGWDMLKAFSDDHKRRLKSLPERCARDQALAVIRDAEDRAQAKRVRALPR